MIWKNTEANEPPTQPHPQPQPPPAAAPRVQPQQGKEPALIGPSIEIKGNLSGGEDLIIEGRIDGKIELRQHGITIGRNGRVKADILGRTIVVMGEVDGNLCGEEQIVLRQTSKVRGNLVAPRVILEDGSNFKGGIDMTPKSAVESPTLKPPEGDWRVPAQPAQRHEKALDKS